MGEAAFLARGVAATVKVLVKGHSVALSKSLTILPEDKRHDRETQRDEPKKGVALFTTTKSAHRIPPRKQSSLVNLPIHIPTHYT